MKVHFLEGIDPSSLPSDDRAAEIEIAHLRRLNAADKLAKLQPVLRASTIAYAARDDLEQSTNKWAGQPNS